MTYFAIPIGSRRRFSASVLLASSMFGCATAGVALTAAAQTVSPAADAPVKRSVQAVPLPTNGSDDQTSWIIEPDVPRIPKLSGVDTKLPPHIERRMSYAFDLAQRGAIYTSSSEFRSVLGLCALELDSRDGGTRHREALRLGLAALEKSDDYDVTHAESMAVDAAENSAGSNSPASDPIQAVQARYAYAEQQLCDSCQGMPGASLAFYGLGRTMVDPGSRTTNAVAKAAVLQQTALTIAPQNVLASNELGVLLAEHGQLDEAEKMFRQCVANNPTPEAWRNLAVVYARKGDQAASRSARAAGDALAKAGPAATKPIVAESLAGAGSASAPVTQTQFVKSDSASTQATTNSDGNDAADSTNTQSKPSFMERIHLSWMLPSIMRR
jgi:hypothetical protein